MAEDYDITVTIASDIGCQRTTNEDSARSVLPGDLEVRRTRGVLVIVADGMGGHSAGEVASRLAVEVIHQTYYGGADGGPPRLADAVLQANRAIFEMAEGNRELAGMGTTCTALVVRGGEAECAHVGDTRLYLVRGDSIYQMTEDHSEVRSLVAQGVLTAEEAQHHADRNVLLRAVGTHPTVEVSTWSDPFPVRAGDRFVLSTDGLHDLVDDEEIKSFVLNEGGQAACDAMLALARSRGGPDNITVALVHIAPPGVPGTDSVRETRAIQVEA
jgi:protein phosphatase